jgi:SAM-dependent methyltransferase
MTDLDYLSLASAMHRLTEPAVRSAISFLPVVPGSRGLDVACGNGDHSLWLARAAKPDGCVCGIDISREGLFRAIESAKSAGLKGELAFLQGDVRSISFPDHLFDWVWCADCLWPGPRSQGFLGMNPLPALQELVRVTRHGGTVALLFWSSQKLLSGHPLLEARLNATHAGCYPFHEGWSPRAHILSAPLWMNEAGLWDITSRTFVADIQGPLSDQAQDDMHYCFQMLWGRAAEELPEKEREHFRVLCTKSSSDFIASQASYYGFITYTLFTGRVATAV